jgi:cytoskeletal protein CcmA (bactofilin family)
VSSPISSRRVTRESIKSGDAKTVSPERRFQMLKKRRSIEGGADQALRDLSKEEATIIGQRISIEGNIQGEGDLTIDGAVKGSIALKKYHLTVGTEGRVEADINAENVTISGRMTGNIRAGSKVEITKEADFQGEIKAKRISVEDGAYLKAVIELEREAQTESAPEVKPPKKEGPVPKDKPLTLVNESDKGA